MMMGFSASLANAVSMVWNWIDIVMMLMMMTKVDIQVISVWYQMRVSIVQGSKVRLSTSLTNAMSEVWNWVNIVMVVVVVVSVVREAVVFLMMPVIRIVSFTFFDGMISTSLEDVEVGTMVPAVVVSVMVMMMTKVPVTEMTSVVVVMVAMGICASFDYFNILDFAKK
jgi:hypothetical protein